jgi:P4 family phage/plasmid primase-like protien
MGRNSNDLPDEEGGKLTKIGDDGKPVKQRRAERLQRKTRIARFKGATIIEVDGNWIDMSSDRFAEACYDEFGHGISKSVITDLEHLFRTTATDLSSRAHLIAFGSRVWDMKKLAWVDTPPEDCVYRVPFEVTDHDQTKMPFILELANGDKGVYDDIMQSVAPLIMDKKPTGVIWYLGSGANGKSTLVHLLYKIFGDYLTEITVKQLEDERDTPQLNGKLGNVCKESSEGFIEDTRTYKSIGTHESFNVHKFHSQDMVQIEGNVHHIFSANNIPTFGDKSYGARRRTLVVPFNNRFKPDETFEDRTFTKKFIERFMSEIVVYAEKLKEQGYEFHFSDTTQLMKDKYDTDANTAQTYVDELFSQDIFGFLNFRLLQMDYENWCMEHGYKPSSINILRRSMDEKGYIRRSVKNEGKVTKMYLSNVTDYNSLDKVAGRTGLYQMAGSEHDEVDRLGEAEQEKLLEDF